MKYKGIVLLKDEGHSVKISCQLLGVSSSGFYSWQKRMPSLRDIRNSELSNKVISVFENAKGRYGAPRVHKTLENQGENIGKKLVASIMKKKGLRAKGKKAFRPTTTINDANDKKSPRIFKIEDEKVKSENEVWVSDLTYIPTDEGFCYLTVVMDLYNREIKGKDISDNMEAVNTKNALLGAIRETSGQLKDVVFHSDQGVQYCSSEVRGLLNTLQITQSMSRKGNCYDNAFAESFFHSLKNELFEEKFKTIAEAKKEIFAYINWYNFERIHSSLGYLSPVDYANENNRCAA